MHVHVRLHVQAVHPLVAFVDVNLSTITPSWVTSALFGHCRHDRYLDNKRGLYCKSEKKQGPSAAWLILCRALMPIINKYAVCKKFKFSLLGSYILQKYVEQQAVLTLRVRSAVTSAQSWDGLLNKRIAVSLLFSSTLLLWIIIYASGMICIRPHDKSSQWYKAISFTHQA